MFGECHMHIFMNGTNYKKAVELHKNGVQDEDIRQKFAQYQRSGISFVRDGGDVLGVSDRARQFAPEYGITYRTPVFAIHKNGHYGGIVGRGFDTMQEYHQLVKQVRKEGGNFIKIMISGIMDFDREGEVNEVPLREEEIREMIHIAHEEGFSVMAHANGARTVQCAVEAGLDSVEHGNFVDEECLQAMKESQAVWVPTFATIANLIGKGRFDDEGLKRLKAHQGGNICRGFELGVKIALGSDAGAFCVPHCQGLQDEYELMQELVGVKQRAWAQESQKKDPNDHSACAQNCVTEVPVGVPLMTKEELDIRLQAAEKEIWRKF